ncbi:DUF6086 family protein [Streptomyces sp. G45]|uniref:DUF6086 family protein n=1 Tax=Streptomyces sp. G45 TaxID=3406627 RepID=UPI003C13EFF6
MSQYFDLGDETLWNPSSGAARLFLRQVRVFEAELGLPSGFGPMEEDECRIDADAFAAFVDALLARHHRTHHAVVLALSEGFVATVLALAERAGVEVDWAAHGGTRPETAQDAQAPAASEDEAWAARLQERARELDRSMAR